MQFFPKWVHSSSNSIIKWRSFPALTWTVRLCNVTQFTFLLCCSHLSHWFIHPFTLTTLLSSSSLHSLVGIWWKASPAPQFSIALLFCCSLSSPIFLFAFHIKLASACWSLPFSRTTATCCWVMAVLQPRWWAHLLQLLPTVNNPHMEIQSLFIAAYYYESWESQVSFSF